MRNERFAPASKAHRPAARPDSTARDAALRRKQEPRVPRRGSREFSNITTLMRGLPTYLHFSVVAAVHDGYATADQIAARLGVPLEEAAEVLAGIVRAGLLNTSAQGIFAIADCLSVENQPEAVAFALDPGEGIKWKVTIPRRHL